MLTKTYCIHGLCNDRFHISPHPMGGKNLEKVIQDWRKCRFDTVVSMLTAKEQDELNLADEEILCKNNNLHYLNYPIRDEVPDSVSRTIEFLNNLERNSLKRDTFLFHCRGGVGRSSMMLALFALSLGMNLKKSFELICRHRGEIAPESEEQMEWVTMVANDPRLFPEARIF